ncbi:MAG TPA: hypothetical protein VEL31_29995 [Ktedonobacteraceae bacterium]|nr:hypothetical protein [Ktedonobacteraceae bacterium]
MHTKNTKHSLLLLFVVALALCVSLTPLSPAAYAASGPNQLLIVRSMGIGSDGARETVTNPQVIQQLYYHILSLPSAPTHKICPLYIIAVYQLTFYHNHTTLINASVLQGGCPTVTLKSGDKRATDDIFWSLFEQVSDLGSMT